MELTNSNSQQTRENRRPSITPDGRYIVFGSARTGLSHVWRMDADGRNAIQLTDGGNGEEIPNLSADGQWIYYSPALEKPSIVMKISINGGSPVRVYGDIPAWAWDPVPSPDGKLLACGAHIDNTDKPWKIAIVPLEGGGPAKLLDVPLLANIKRWSKDSQSIIYISDGTGAQLWQQPIDGSPATKLIKLSNERLYNFAFSPDFQKVAYSLGKEWSEAVLISNFRKE